MHSTSTSSISSLLSSCYGLSFLWVVSPRTNMQMNIPWACTVPGTADELSFMINVIDGQVFACSRKCTRILQPNGVCCPSCAGLGPRVCDLGDTITSYKTWTRHTLLMAAQLYAVIDECNHELNQWKFKVCSLYIHVPTFAYLLNSLSMMVE